MSMKSQSEEKLDKMKQQLAQIKIQNEQLVGSVQKHQVLLLLLFISIYLCFFQNKTLFFFFFTFYSKG